MKKTKVAIVGCGSISEFYLTSLRDLYSDYCVVDALCDIYRPAAEQRAQQFNIPRVLTLEALWADPEIEIVLNLTIPSAHCEIICAALESGKHVYTEKPLATTMEEAEKIKATSERTGKTVCCATDVWLGAAGQTALKAIKAGYIGDVFGVHCVCTHPLHGNEHWHPNPYPFYQKGAAPMNDMGPYYFNFLISVLGPVKTVSSVQTMNFPERVITSMPHKGETIHVEVPTHVVGTFTFGNGAVGTIINSLDIWNTRQPHLEIHGTEGTIVMGDPNQFNGEVLISRLSHGDDKWSPLPQLVEYTDTLRGIGLSDMILALQEGRTPRCSLDIGMHLVEIFSAFDEAAETHTTIELKTTCQTPKARWETA